MIIPLTNELDRIWYGYKIDDKKISPLFIMDELKLYGKDDNELEGMLHIVKTFSDDSEMEYAVHRYSMLLARDRNRRLLI